jgi:hypothetical protein
MSLRRRAPAGSTAAGGGFKRVYWGLSPAQEDAGTRLHRQLSAERIFIAFDSSDSETAAGAAKADKAIPMSEIALDRRLVPCLRVPNITDRQVEVFGPEERDHRKGFLSYGRSFPFAKLRHLFPRSIC